MPKTESLVPSFRKAVKTNLTSNGKLNIIFPKSLNKLSSKFRANTLNFIKFKKLIPFF